MNIETIKARQVFDSRGYPTVECDVFLSDGSMGRASVPSGASTGGGEALELRDGGKAFGGKGVSRAVANISGILVPALKGKDAYNQLLIDDLMIKIDGTENKSMLGANATIAVSLAVSRAAAVSRKVPLFQHISDLAGNKTCTIPMPMLNILNGGKHASGSTDIQEFMIIPIGAVKFSDAVQMASEIYHSLGKLLKSEGYATTVGDEGGFAPGVKNGSNEALDLILSAVSSAGYTAGKDIGIAIDVASNELVEGEKYKFSREGGEYTTDELITYYENLRNKFPSLISIEDGLSEADWDGWIKLNQKLGNDIQLVADDLLVTNTKLLKRAIKENSANSILIKTNQIGTLSESIEAVNMAKEAGWTTVVSHRSGETEDAYISHLAVGLNAGQIKTGSFARSDRISKYNELIRIAEVLGNPDISNPFSKK